MRCPECKAQVPDNLSLCPECGEMVQDTRPSRRVRRSKGGEKTRPMRVQRSETGSGASFVAALRAGPLNWKLVLRIALIAAGALALLALVVFVGGYLGLHQGEIDRQEARLQEANDHYNKGETLREQGDHKLAIAEFQYALKLDPNHPYAQQRIDEVLAERYRVGLEYLNGGECELAIAEFEYILQVKPDHSYAQQGLDQARAGLAASLTPTPVDLEAMKSDLYQQAVAQYEAGEWEKAAATLNQLRAIDPGYEAEAVEEMLFNSHYNAGIALLEQNRLEEGIFHLDQAITMRPSSSLAQEAQAQRDLAELYLTAMGYWGVDWERCVARFETLYTIAPGYKDVYQRLYLAHVAYGNDWYDKNEMCPAEEQYTLALQMGESEELRSKRDSAAEVCAVATPVPVTLVAGTDVITLTELPPRFNSGRLAFPVHDTSAGRYDVYVLSTDKRAVRMAVGADQPCWMRNNGALGYRDLISPGISVLGLGAATPQRITSGSVAWPTFSADGGRVAYASRETGAWQIYIAPVDGSSEPQVLAAGNGPAWASNGWLAWTGCETGGECGIFIDNPDDSQPPARVSDNADDTALSWSPDGSRLAYMSDFDGDWDVYLYTPATSSFVQLTENPASDGLPTWSPDGSSIAFVSDRGGAWGLYVTGPDGGETDVILDLGPSMPNWTLQRIAWGP
jgi:tetratricopeptide (TPR) repeat protein